MEELQHPHGNEFNLPHEEMAIFLPKLVETGKLFTDVKTLTALEPSIRTLAGTVSHEGSVYEVGFLTDSDEGKSAKVTVFNKSTYDKNSYEVLRTEQYQDTNGLIEDAWVEILVVKPLGSDRELPLDSKERQLVINILHPFLKVQKEILEEEVKQKEANRFAKQERWRRAVSVVTSRLPV